MRVSKSLISLVGITIATLSMTSMAGSALSFEPSGDRQVANAAAKINNVQGNLEPNLKSSAKSLPLTVTFAPRPGKDKPVNTSGAGTRGSCLTSEVTSSDFSESADSADNLTLILPAVTPALTAQARPTFMFYVPKTKAQQVEFRLFANVENELGEPQTGVYRQTIDLNNQLNGEAGIISYSLPAESPMLQLDQSYAWSVALICNQNKRSRDIVVQGAIERVELSASLASQLAQATLAQQAQLYAQDGIWYEAAAILAQLNRNDHGAGAEQLWQSLLGAQQVELEAIASNPIVVSN
ncbi:protein of unknown function DUF928 (plasmid) [Thalassoporum mexicanum PCC 7367]|uniref:DUF928 domain-containing protein n=1 Tax=Thalassoporum mexicanum TaxID=3457544 RepID=UPI00029FED12|nr:DUF928 domain-containing protein [Pseudanabaena sp. PCC 7367]AFY71886.1 protein of unknown function DUF928 [Pseudanabaena sp. PCC 7367]